MPTHLPLIAAAGFISIGMFRLTDPLLPAIAEEFSSSIGSVAMTVTAFTLGYGMFQLVYGPLGDRIGKLRVMAAALMVAARLPRPAAPGPGHVRITHLALLRRRDTRVVWGGVFLEGCFVMGAVPYAGAALKHQFGLDYFTIGLILGSFGVGGLLYSASVRWLVANLGERGTAMSGFALSLFLGQGMGVYVVSHLVDGPGYGAAFAIAGIGTALVAFGLWIMLAAHKPATDARH